MKRLINATLVALAMTMPAMASSKLMITDDMVTDGQITKAFIEPEQMGHGDNDGSMAVARCKRGELDFFIVSNDGMVANYYGNTLVKVRWNKGKVYDQQWRGSKKAASAWSKTGPEFIDAVIDNNELILEWYTPDGTRSAKFDLVEAREDLKAVREACAK